MTRSIRSWSCRTVLVVLLVGAATTWATAQGPGRPVSPGSAARPDSQARLHALYATLTISLALVVLLIIGALVIKQAGRRATEGQHSSEPTEYVDAWSHYRLPDDGTDDQQYPRDEPPYDENGDDTDANP